MIFCSYLPTIDLLEEHIKAKFGCIVWKMQEVVGDFRVVATLLCLLAHDIGEVGIAVGRVCEADDQKAPLKTTSPPLSPAAVVREADAAF